MSKLLVVFGATGQQGGSVVNYVSNDPELSKEFKIRAITRDVTSAKAQQLKKHGEVVAGDPTDPSTLKTALAGVHTVFALTNPSFTPNGYETEYNSAKAIADAAVAQGAKYIIFSTLPGIKKLSHGKYDKVIHFDAKADAESYIRTLPVPSAFVSLGGYMENYNSLGPFVPQKVSDDTWAISLPLKPTSKLPLINAVEDTGKFVGAILADPDKYSGKTFAASVGSYSMSEVVAALSKSSGKKIVYNQIELGQFVQHLPPILDTAFPGVLGFAEELGYYGPKTDEEVAWAVENARGKLNTFEEYLEAHPFQLS